MRKKIGRNHFKREWLYNSVNKVSYNKKEAKGEKMIPFKEYFKVLLDGNPDEFIEIYFNHNDKPYPERYKEFEIQLRALDNSGIKLTEEMEDVIEEIDDVESGYGDVKD